jgi:hypothetical protein
MLKWRYILVLLGLVVAGKVTRQPLAASAKPMTGNLRRGADEATQATSRRAITSDHIRKVFTYGQTTSKRK